MISPRHYLAAPLVLLGGCRCGWGDMCTGGVWLDEYQCWTAADAPPVPSVHQDVSTYTVGPDGRCWLVFGPERPPDWGAPGAAFEDVCTDEVLSGPECYFLLGYNPPAD